MNFKQTFNSALFVTSIMNIIKYIILFSLGIFTLDNYDTMSPTLHKTIPMIWILVIILLSMYEAKRFAFDLAIRDKLFNRCSLDKINLDSIEISKNMITKKKEEKKPEQQENNESKVNINKDSDIFLNKYGKIIRKAVKNIALYAFNTIWLSILVGYILNSTINSTDSLSLLEIFLATFFTICVFIAFYMYIQLIRSTIELVFYDYASNEIYNIQGVVTKITSEHLTLQKKYNNLVNNYNIIIKDAKKILTVYSKSIGKSEDEAYKDIFKMEKDDESK